MFQVFERNRILQKQKARELGDFFSKWVGWSLCDFFLWGLIGGGGGGGRGQWGTVLS